jgi:Phage terminase large subunit (GpA)
MPSRQLFKKSLFADRSTANKKSIDFPGIDFMSVGGQWFVDAIQKYGINEHGDKLRIYPPLLEVAVLVGDFRIAEVNLTGAAQVFKSLIMIELAAAAITIGKINVIQSYPQSSTIHKLVPTQYKPIVDAWELALGLDKKQSASDSKSREIHQSRYGTLRFMGVNNARATSKQQAGLAAAATNVVAVSTELLLCDERSQSSARDLEPLDKRLLQSRLPVKVRRYYGTPGGGSGIEMDISQSNYDFVSHVRCKGCDRVSELSPLGWLIKEVRQEGKPPKYFDDAGRPIEWHHHDESDPAGSAYYGCPSCGHEIADIDRTHGSWFQCRKTGVTLRDMLAAIPAGVPVRSISAGITLSPLIRY